MIRSARPEDCSVMADLLVQLGYPDATADDARRRLGGLLAGGDHAVFVEEAEWSTGFSRSNAPAEAGAPSHLTGFIHVCVTLTLEHDPRGEIRTLVVDEKQRGAGAGARLVAAAEEWARERGLRKMRVRSNIKRERARRFYERLGYSVTKTQNVFDKVL